VGVAEAKIFRGIFMKLRVFTLTFDDTSGRFDDHALVEFLAGRGAAP